ncbi:hypothetical protein J2S77_000951 [Alkalibacillus salilacus]|uniref:Uncharacterized protein n=1 Tax=Alkalibacillus salilacus TaxID=284582 RepID=A0ABT9VDJ8_9BACI|nr:hypothetical protein [Alkalibacillus salilacus]
MPIKFRVYLIRYVDLETGSFYEKEKEEPFVNTLESTLSDRFQILHKQYLKTRYLV